MENAKTETSKIKVALLRGDFLSEWEGNTWYGLGDEVQTTAFCGKKNINSLANMRLEVKRMNCTSDNFVSKNFFKYLFGYYRKMYGLEKQLSQFDIVDTYELYNYFTTQAVTAKKVNKKLKIVTHFADNTFGRFEYNYWPFFKSPPAYWRNKINKIMRENLEASDFFIASSKYSEAMLLDYGAPKEKVKTVTYGISVSKDDIATANIGVDFEGHDVYMMVNRITKEKGVYEVLYGWKMFVETKPNVKRHLLIIGNGPERFNLMRLAQELGLMNSITFIKSVPNSVVRNLYKKAKCLILDSLPTSVWQEQFGFVLAEAISCDCPVISTYSGAIPEVVEKAGLLVSPGHPLEIRDALLKLDDPATYQMLKENCEKIKGKFSMENFKIQVLDIYKNLVNK